jgi:STE24 endopeptidase
MGGATMAQGFDAAAATAAYLAQLPPELHVKAAHYTHGKEWMLLWATLVTIVVGVIVLRLGVLVRVRDKIEAEKPRPWLAAFVVMLVFSIVESVLSLPWSIYAGWWRETAYGMTSQGFIGWFDEWAVQLGIGAVTTAILFTVIYQVIRKAPRSWWLWGGLVATAFAFLMLVLSPVFIAPIFNQYTPAPPGPVRDAVVAMAKANGVPSDKIYIYNGSKQSNRYTANVAGLFGTARVAMSDVMFQKNADLAEVKAVVGHEMGHYVEQHTMLIAAAFGALLTLAFFLIDRLFPWVVRLTGAQGVTGVGDPAGNPALGIIFSVLVLAATPITNSIIRIGESRADQFSLDRVREPDGLARALVKTIEYRAATPSRLEEVIFYDHPAVGNRVRRAMDWKAAHMAPSK